LIIVHNKDDAVYLERQGFVGRSQRVEVVSGSGVDIGPFAHTPPPRGSSNFLMVSRLLGEKGIREFVEAARMVTSRLPDVKFRHVGGGDSNPSAIGPEELGQWRLEGVVEFVGHVDDPTGYFDECDVFVLPSYREGLPRTNLEALAAGRPIITTDVAGCRETVIDGINGILVPAEDSISLAEAITRLAEDVDSCRTMGQAGRRLCLERFELDHVSEATVRLLLGSDSLTGS
jgi:glycosyltransferase involved in cell wall biosynthesis